MVVCRQLLNIPVIKHILAHMQSKQHCLQTWDSAYSNTTAVHKHMRQVIIIPINVNTQWLTMCSAHARWTHTHAYTHIHTYIHAYMHTRIYIYTAATKGKRTKKAWRLKVDLNLSFRLRRSLLTRDDMYVAYTRVQYLVDNALKYARPVTPIVTYC